MTNFKRIELVDGSWLTGKIEPVIKSSGSFGNVTTRTVITFKADMRDIVELDSPGIDSMIQELLDIKEKMLEMDLEVNPPEEPLT